MNDEREHEIVININLDEEQEITELDHQQTHQDDNIGNEVTAMDYAEVLCHIYVRNYCTSYFKHHWC